MVISFSPVLYFHCFFLYGVCDFFCLLCWWRKQPFANKHGHRRIYTTTAGTTRSTNKSNHNNITTNEITFNL